MNKKEFSSAIKIAESQKDLSSLDLSVFFGFGLKDFQPVYVTLDSIAALIRYQCFAIFEHKLVDTVELNAIGFHGKKKFNVV
jgi:hypothetical protein